MANVIVPVLVSPPALTVRAPKAPSATPPITPLNVVDPVPATVVKA